MSASRTINGDPEASHVTVAQREALCSAARWYVQLSASENEADQLAWKRWHESKPLNQWAWTRIETLQRRLHGVAGPQFAQTLRIARGQRNESSAIKRRSVLRGLAGIAVTGCLGYELVPWYRLRASYATNTGEKFSTTLPDSTRIVLDTRSAVRVQFDSEQRQLQLLSGEVFIQTGRDPSSRYRPFTVHTAEGTVKALGTRFSVRQQDAVTRVVVLEDEVEIRPLRGIAIPLRLHANRQASFTTQEARAPQDADERLVAWTEGRLAVSDWTLAEFAAELGRYRSGWLRCDPDVADLRVSGAFPVHDTDAALRAVERALPVEARYITPYWVTLQRR